MCVRAQKGVVAMTGNVGDVIQVTLAATWQAVQCLSVYYYRVVDAPTAGYLTGLSTEFQSQVLTAYAPTQIIGETFDSLRLLNIFTGDELIVGTLTPAGGSAAATGDMAPSFTAANIRLIRANARVRNGRKQVPLTRELDYVGNFLSAGIQTVLNTFAATLDNQLVAGGIDTFDPVIVGRVPYVTASGRTAYRLPSTIEEMGDNWSVVAGATLVNRVTTMNSRKFWRGV